jgi:hypothetical protein
LNRDEPTEFEKPFVDSVQEVYRKFEEFRGAVIAKYLGLDSFETYVRMTEEAQKEVDRMYGKAINAGVRPEVLVNPFKKPVGGLETSGLHEGKMTLPDGQSYTLILYVDEQQRVTTLTPLASVPVAMVQELLDHFSWNKLGTLNQS